MSQFFISCRTILENIMNFIDSHGGFFTLLGAIITLLGTVLVMLFVDYQNKNRWEKDSFLKAKNTYIMNIIKASANLLYKINNIKNISENQLKTLNEFSLDEFEDLYKNLSSLNVFYNNKNSLAIENFNLLDDLQIYLDLFTCFKLAMQNTEIKKYLQEKKLLINGKIDLTLFINILKEQKVILIGGYKFSLYKEFKTKYNDDVNILIDKLEQQIQSLHEKLTDFVR